MKSTRIITAFVLPLGIAASSCSIRQVYQAPNTKQAATQANAININTATVDELEKLPNIGRNTAETIVQFRVANGPFRRPESLMQIRGISEKRFLEIREHIKTE